MDFDILLLGCFYVVVLCAFVLFEVVEVNYRPLLIEGVLEASYPSSTTMLSVCGLSTAVMQFMARISNRVLRIAASAAAIALEVFLVVGRIISGVHWASDIIGGLLLSAGLVVLYYAAVCAVGDHIAGKKN